MSAPVSATITFRAPVTNPGNGTDEVAEGLKRLDHHLDPGGQLRDLAAALVDGLQIQAGQEPVVAAESAG